MKSRKVIKNRISFIILLSVLVLLILLGLILGSVDIEIKDIIAILTRQDVTSKKAIIIWNVRLPRVIGGVLAGAGLGTAGVILQEVMNNSLVSPNTIGVNSGAGFFVMLSMMLAPQNLFAKSIMAFMGAFITSIFILCLAYMAEKSRITIVLAGITISSFLSAGMNLMKIIDTDLNINATHFLIGSLAGITFKAITYPSVGIIFCVIITIIFSKALNILALGDGVANSIGLPVNICRFAFVMVASSLAGMVVSFAGLIGFVGLIVPHICRYLFGHDARVLVPASSLAGAVFVLVSDLLSRVLCSPYELPVGIILSLTGGPFFLYLLMRKGGRRVNA